MTHDRWSSDDAELTNALKALYAAPVEESYWDGLEARIIARVAERDDSPVWWSELAHMARPGLAAAAALILAASLALVHSRQLEVNSAYASVISAVPASIETAARAGSVGDGDVAIHFLLSH